MPASVREFRAELLARVEADVGGDMQVGCGRVQRFGAIPRAGF